MRSWKEAVIYGIFFWCDGGLLRAFLEGNAIQWRTFKRTALTRVQSQVFEILLAIHQS
ncbi:hypothetical protein ACFSKM_21955 [Ancylobacter dichloromethanicus]